MKTLIIGDQTDYLANYAIKQDKSASLIIQESADRFITSATGTFYTSLAEFKSIHTFCEVLMAADVIEYAPPTNGHWSDQRQAPDPRFSMETETKEHLRQWSYLKKRPVIGLLLPDYLDPVVNKTITYHNRISQDRQIWNVGCSITHGNGVEPNETYGHLIKETLNLPFQKIAYEGSSIRWASDQIISADIRKGDIVIWGLTALHRFGYFLHDDRYYHLTSRFFSNYPLINHFFAKDCLLQPNVVYESLKSIQTANNFCNKCGADLIILGVLSSYQNERDISTYPNFIACQQSFLDKGSDGMHPGPKHHRLYAELIIKYIKNHMQDFATPDF